MNKLLYSVLAIAITVPLFVGVTTAAPAKIAEDTSLQQVGPADLTQSNLALDKTTVPTVSKQKPNFPVVQVKAEKITRPYQKSSSTVRTLRQPTGSKSVVSHIVRPSRSAANVGSKATAIITTAKRFIGVKYVWGGITPAGFDCSGFVQYVFAHNGISLPRNSRAQFNTGKAVSFSSLRPGDLVFFSLASNGIVDHVGIYVGGGQFINASTSKGVTIYAIGPYWRSHFIGARRVL